MKALGPGDSVRTTKPIYRNEEIKAGEMASAGERGVIIEWVNANAARVRLETGNVVLLRSDEMKPA